MLVRPLMLSGGDIILVSVTARMSLVSVAVRAAQTQNRRGSRAVAQDALDLRRHYTCSSS